MLGPECWATLLLCPLVWGMKCPLTVTADTCLPQISVQRFMGHRVGTLDTYDYEAVAAFPSVGS